MKKLIVGICAFLFVMSAALSHADTQLGDGFEDGNVRILPVCYSHGPVYMEVGSEKVIGYIGQDKVELVRRKSFFIGEIRGHKLVLHPGNEVVEGTFAGANVHWRMSPEGDAIYGYLNCIYTN